MLRKHDPQVDQNLNVDQAPVHQYIKFSCELRLCSITDDPVLMKN